MLLRVATALFALQAGFHGFTASLPVALARSGVRDEEIGLIVGLAALAGALVLGSIGVSPIIATAGFEATILATIVGLVLASLVALADPGLASHRRAATPTERGAG